jgi:hypothetical protein
VPASDDRIATLLRLLQAPTDAATAAAQLGISQPTFARLWPTVPDIVALGAARARKYALRRHVPGVDTPLPVSQVTAQGTLHPRGQLHVLQDGWYALTEPSGNGYRLYQGLPFFLQDMRPQGFLGRMEPVRHSDLELPHDILRWTDDHTLKYLSRRGEHSAGDIVIGGESHARLMASLRDGFATVTQDERQRVYPALAEAAAHGDLPGSSAGGEQPKFTCMVQRADAMLEHVIVKFSPRTGSESGRRWADLLLCEYLALATLSDHGLPAAAVDIIEADGRVFLEVVRFDRISRHGRAPMATFDALDGDLGMADQSWSAVARELAVQRRLPQADVERIEVFDLFGALIGNVDKHHGNIAVSWDFDGRCRLLPAYDMLPMLYRPNTHGEVIARTWQPASLNRMNLNHLPRCAAMAMAFWRRVLEDGRISAGFKAVARGHAEAIATAAPGAAA